MFAREAEELGAVPVAGRLRPPPGPGRPGEPGRPGRRRLEDGRPVGLLQRHEDFLAEDLHVARGVDAEADLVALDLEDGDDDVVADHDRLVGAAGEDQHGKCSFRGTAGLRDVRGAVQAASRGTLVL